MDLHHPGCGEFVGRFHVSLATACSGGSLAAPKREPSGRYPRVSFEIWPAIRRRLTSWKNGCVK